MARMIKVSVEVNFAGCHIPDTYEELPEGWDDWAEDEQQQWLSDSAMDAMSFYASCGAEVVET